MTLPQSLKKAIAGLKDRVEDVIDDLIPEDEPVGGQPRPVLRRVLVVIYDPRIKSEGGHKLSQAMKWNDPDALIPQYIQDLRESSYGYANFEVVERAEVDRFPVKADGFVYGGDDFVQHIRTNSGFHQPDAVDYHRILEDFDIIAKIDRQAIDEVWLFAFPYAGFYESIMAGPGAFWCNAPPLEGTEHASRRFVIMGYNYQRGVGEMIENLGHRAESIMDHVFRHKKGEDNLWKRFTRYDKTHPGQAEVGIVHYAPNSQIDYDWGNRTRVLSRCHTWHNFPNLEGEAREMDCDEWGNGDTRAHHLWWFRHFPHITGGADGVAYNWWRYVIDPNTVR